MRNHCSGRVWVFRRNRSIGFSRCRIALCESIRFIVEQYVPRSQIHCASFWQGSDQTFRILRKAKSSSYGNWINRRRLLPQPRNKDSATRRINFLLADDEAPRFQGPLVALVAMLKRGWRDV